MAKNDRRPVGVLVTADQPTSTGTAPVAPPMTMLAVELRFSQRLYTSRNRWRGGEASRQQVDGAPQPQEGDDRHRRRTRRARRDLTGDERAILGALHQGIDVVDVHVKAWAPPRRACRRRRWRRSTTAMAGPATIIVGTVVTSSNSTIRSFIRATNALTSGASARAVADMPRLRPLRQLQPAGPNVLGMFRGAISPERYVQLARGALWSRPSS